MGICFRTGIEFLEKGDGNSSSSFSLLKSQTVLIPISLIFFKSISVK